LGLSIKEETSLKNQELFAPGGGTPPYWEGAVRYEGRRGDRPVRGAGYLEMTGYEAR
jgi:predicted secreted hydrolase